MATSTGQSKVLAKLQARSKGAYGKVKDHEAKVGGRSLPGGIDGGTAIITDAKLDETKNGDPYFFIYSTVVSPVDYQGVFVGLMYQLYEDQYATYDDKLERLLNDMKLIGFDEIVRKSKNEQELIPKLIDAMKKDKITYVYNTGRKQKKDGTYTVFVQGLPEEGQETPTPKGKNEHADEGYQEVEVPFPVGCRVTTSAFEDGNVYSGEVVEVDANAEIATIKFDDGDQQDLPFADIQLEENAATSEQTEPEAEESQAKTCKACGGSGKNSKKGKCVPCEGTGYLREEKTSPFEVGDRVQSVAGYFGGDEVYEGEVQALDGDTVTVLFDDETTVDIEAKDLEAVQ